MTERHTTIGILGNQGHFGRFIETLLLPQVLSNCPYTVHGLDQTATLSAFDLLLKDAHHCVPCLPLHSYHTHIGEILTGIVTSRAQHHIPTYLWIIASLQAPVFQRIEQYMAILPPALHHHLHIIGLHPLYGPNSFSTNPVVNRSNALHNVITSTTTHEAKLMADTVQPLFEAIGITTTMVESPLEHDRIVATTQGLVFRFALFCEEDATFSALLQQHFPHLYFTFQADTALMKAFIRLNPTTAHIIVNDTWHKTARSSRADLLETFRLLDAYHNPTEPHITTRNYNELRRLAQTHE